MALFCEKISKNCVRIGISMVFLITMETGGIKSGKGKMWMDIRDEAWYFIFIDSGNYAAVLDHYGADRVAKLFILTMACSNYFKALDENW